MKILLLMLSLTLGAYGMDQATAIRHARTIADTLNGKVWGISDTGSMLPTLTPSSVVVVAPVAYDEIKVGDIITFTRPIDDATVAHRVIKIDRYGRIWTQGDSAERNDGVLTPDRLNGRVVAILHTQ